MPAVSLKTSKAFASLLYTIHSENNIVLNRNEWSQTQPVIILVFKVLLPTDSYDSL